jgi:hypothetical protein
MLLSLLELLALDKMEAAPSKKITELVVKYEDTRDLLHENWGVLQHCWWGGTSAT